nr:uncharacterized protein LOC107453965 [Parasteatoda tepidariorum]
MASYFLLFSFFLSINLLITVSAKSVVVSDVPVEAVTNVSQNGISDELLRLRTDIITCDCGSGSIACVIINGKKLCGCEPGKTQIGEACHTPVPYGWKIATIIIAVIFGITLVGMGVFIFKRY